LKFIESDILFVKRLKVDILLFSSRFYIIIMRGVWYLIEAVISILIILIFLLALRGTMIIEPSQDVSLTGYNLLKGLDDRGILRNYTTSNNYDLINNSIRYYVHNHSVEICNHQGTCSGYKPNATNVHVATYIISGDNFLNPYEVKLYLY